jgi:hypothetical protein
MLETSKIEMLANLLLHDHKAVGACKLPVAGTFWRRPTTTNDPYRGFREIHIHMLTEMYQWLENEPLAEFVDSYSS